MLLSHRRNTERDDGKSHTHISSMCTEYDVSDAERELFVAPRKSHCTVPVYTLYDVSTQRELFVAPLDTARWEECRLLVL